MAQLRPGKRIPQTGKVKNGVLRRNGYTCVYCGYKATNLQEVRGLTVDHVEPVASGGDNSRGNKVCACTICNQYASDFLFETFQAKREFIRNRIQEKGYKLWN